MIKKLSLKHTFLLLLIGLSWLGFSTIGETWASFLDNETSLGNTFTAATLDVSLRSGQGNFVPTEKAENMKPGDSVARDIYIGKTVDSLALKHRVSYQFLGGDADFCNVLQLKIWYNHYHCNPSGGYAVCRDMRLKYNGPLTALSNLTDADFVIPHPDDLFDTNPSNGIEQWFYYSISFPAELDGSYQGKTCQFKFVYDGWQTNFADPASGFTDKEEILSHLVDYSDPTTLLTSTPTPTPEVTPTAEPSPTIEPTSTPTEIPSTPTPTLESTVTPTVTPTPTIETTMTPTPTGGPEE